jgi:signal transduction histidine kinase
MELSRRSSIIYGLLLGIWLLVVGWQVEEHFRFKAYAKNSLRNRSRAIANTLGASVRGLQFRGAVFRDRLEPVLTELVNPRTNELNTSAEVLAIRLMNASGDTLAAAGNSSDIDEKEAFQEGERWDRATAVFAYPIEGVRVSSEGATNLAPPILLPPFTNSFRDGRDGRDSRGSSRRDGPPSDLASTNEPAGRPAESTAGTNIVANAGSNQVEDRPPPPPERSRRFESSEPGRPRRPFWARGMSEEDYQSLMQHRELHGAIIAMSTANLQAAVLHDLWLRFVIGFFATMSVLGATVAWRTVSKTSELQIRLIRASEQNTHLKEMNLAAAGLAHETRNPLNIIRGLAHMISRQPEASAEVKGKSADIVKEADKVAAQLNEFINYSKPRDVRRTPLSINTVVNEVSRALSYDLEEKQILLENKSEPLTVEADEQLLRQALFNLILNAAQAVDGDGHIEVFATRQNASEAALEIRDNGPGVPAGQRAEIFKPYFTTQKTGTGLGLAVVQQIVLAHGWEIECLPNSPKGAVFRITHLKVAG